jgi:hypothetical protein
MKPTCRCKIPLTLKDYLGVRMWPLARLAICERLGS